MAGNNSTINNIASYQISKRLFCQQWRILALFAVFCCNASLPVAASTVGNRVDSSTEISPGVGLVTTDDISDMPKRSAENLQMPHLFRHQEHYSQRIENAVKEMKHTQLHQALSGNYSSIAKIADSISNNQYIHFQSQLQPQMPEHLQQRYNRRRYSMAPVNTWKRYNIPPIRHQRHQPQQQNEVQNRTTAAASILRTISPAISQIGLVTTEAPPGDFFIAKTVLPLNSSNRSHQYTKSHRFYDRDGLYQHPYKWTTKGPQVNADKNEWQKTDNEGVRFQDRKQMNSQRISLNYVDLNGEKFKQVEPVHQKRPNSDSSESNYSPDMATSIDRPDDFHQIDTDDMDSNDEYDDYSYDHSKGERDTSANEFPNGGEHRTAVKRYTNPFKELRLPPKKRDYPHPFPATRRRASIDQANVDDDSNTYVNSETDSEDNSDADFSSEKWQRIEQEHHRKQQEHQRQMLALRVRHDDGKYRALAAAATTSPATLSAPVAAVKQQRHSDDEYYDNLNSQNYIPGTLTRQKQEELGTLAAVQQSRRSHVIKHKHEKALAGEHVKQILSEATCRVPQRRVERIQQDPSKLYMPHCTVLHRCTDESGCCRSDRQTCAPKHTKNVDLYFYVRSINEKRGTVERLTFVNHTECHCIEKSRQQVEEYHNLPMYDGISHSGQTLRRATILNCNCPKLYEKILQEDGFCRCDCSSGNTGCDWLKRGMEHFSMIDRKCISEGRCKPPTCEHGNYIKKYGRCPRREEQLSVALTGAFTLATNTLSGGDYH